jgi:glutamine---fructose-6-phosphate transaminase (isomerizing)
VETIRARSGLCRFCPCGMHASGEFCMCGIVGAVAARNVVPILLEGLRRLEYRGYDSAGVAVLNGALRRLRSTGRVAELARLSAEQGLDGKTGIAHTRWATHGAPSEKNAHPHVSAGISVVHNGIIENHDDMRSQLRARGYEFVSDTDTEVIAHLIHSHLSSGGLLQAVQRSVAELAGAYAIAVISESEPQRLVVARMGAPLLLGLGEGETFAASDASALVQVTRRIVYLEEGDCAEISRTGARIVDAAGNAAKRTERLSELTSAAVELGQYRHYMQKEIFEQPMAVANTLEMVTGARAILPQLFGAGADKIFNKINGLLILACGTSYHAAMVARYWLEGLAGIPCNVEIASEYRYRESVPNPQALVVTISQSGETADTLAALQHAKSLGHRHSLAICNVPESALLRASELRFLTRAGPEIGVASTKAFTTQLAALVLLTMALAKQRGRLTPEQEVRLLQALRHLPAALTHVLGVEPQIAAWAERFAQRHHALFLGRGIHYPIAMEGALKLKEISYIHAEAYAAGELKHGPLALVDQHMPVVAIAPRDALLEKLKSNLQEVRARGGELYVIADQDTHFADGDGIHVLRMPDHAGLLSPILHTVPLQLLAYHVALHKGTDVDKPRNLAKSVTVE